MARLDPTGVSRILSYIKTWVTNALGGKANSSHSHSDYIPKSGGGVLEGQDFKRTVDNSTLNVYGGQGYGHGAFLQLTGTGDAGAGEFNIQAHDGVNSKVLKGKADGTLTWNGVAISLSGHTHTKSQITDFPTIPTNTNQLTNGAGFITSSGSCNYANSAGYVQGNNNSANAANALLRSGSGRTNSSPEGDTWIFLDEAGGTSTPWGFKHNQGANTIGFYGRGTETSSINLSNGYFSGSCNYANSSGNADTLDGYHHDSFPKTSAALFTVNGLGTPGWSKIGTGEGGSCIQVKTTDNTYPSICFHRSGHSHCVLAESGGQLGTMQQGGSFNHLITSANIGSQSVNYANSAGSVAWGNVSGRPTALSQFTNDSEFWSPGGGKWNPNANISLPASGNGQEWSFDMHRNGKTGCYWHVWEDSLGSLLKVNADDGAVSVPRNIFYLGSYKVYVG